MPGVGVYVCVGSSLGVYDSYFMIITIWFYKRLQKHVKLGENCKI